MTPPMAAAKKDSGVGATMRSIGTSRSGHVALRLFKTLQKRVDYTAQVLLKSTDLKQNRNLALFQSPSARPGDDVGALRDSSGICTLQTHR